MLKILVNLLRPGGDLVIALDPYQDLYRKESSWVSIGIEARGTRQLRRVYRNTREIERFARRFIGEENQESPQLELFRDDLTCSGPPPELLRFESQDKLEDFLIQDIRTVIGVNSAVPKSASSTTTRSTGPINSNMRERKRLPACFKSWKRSASPPSGSPRTSGPRNSSTSLPTASPSSASTAPRALTSTWFTWWARTDHSHGGDS